jgi:hypothetical protein
MQGAPGRLAEHARPVPRTAQRASPLNLLALDGTSGGGRARVVHGPDCEVNSRVTPPAGSPLACRSAATAESRDGPNTAIPGETRIVVLVASA